MRISDWSSDVCSSDLDPAQYDGDLVHGVIFGSLAGAERFEPTRVRETVDVDEHVDVLRVHSEQVVANRTAGDNSSDRQFGQDGVPECGTVWLRGDVDGWRGTGELEDRKSVG